jgi:hypothetical protein
MSSVMVIFAPAPDLALPGQISSASPAMARG